MCGVCGYTGRMLDSEAGREGDACPNCSCPARARALVYALGMCLGLAGQPLYAWPQKDLRVLEASGRGGYPVFLAEKVCYTNGEYPSLDLERLDHPDSSLDVVLAGDVFEHVRDDERAFKEVHRVLKADGRLLFTVPLEGERTLVRVDADGRFLAPPEYHGGGGQSLAYRTYGRDLLDRLQKIGFAVACVRVSEQEVFVCQKGSYVEMHAASPEAGARAVPLVPLRLWALAKYNLRAAGQVMRELRARFGW